MKPNKLPNPPSLKFKEAYFEFHLMENEYLFIRIQEHQDPAHPKDLEGFQNKLLELLATYPIIIADIRAAKAPNQGMINWSIQLQKKAEPMVQAVAFIVKSPISTFIANLFTGILRRSYKTKTFNSTEQAIEWAMSMTLKSQPPR